MRSGKFGFRREVDAHSVNLRELSPSQPSAMADSLGVGFRYEEIYEMCQKAINIENEKNRKEEIKVEMAGTSARNRLKNSFKTHYQGNSRRYRQGQMSVRIVGGILALRENNCFFKDYFSF